MSWKNNIVGLWQAGYEQTLQRVAELGGADLVFTSPPYANARTYGNDVSWTFQDYQRLGDAILVALKPGGHCILNLDANVSQWRKGFGSERGLYPWKVMIDWAERVGMRVPDRLAYCRQGLPGEYKGRFRNDWEPLLWFQRVGGTPWMDRLALAEAARHPKKGKASSRAKDGTLIMRQRSGHAVETGIKHRGTLWQYGNVGHGHDDSCFKKVGHPARFCLALASDVIRCFCPPNGLVVDPFLGSGTTMIAALDNGRRFSGGDLYCRGTDRKPWVDVALEIAEDRYSQQATH